jgi:hypothetical protein
MGTNHINQSRWRLLPAVIAIGLLGAASSPAATLLLSLQSVLASSPSTGNAFEVDLTNTGSDVVVNSFSFGLTANTQFIFTSATTSTVSSTYIFDGIGNSFFGPDITTSSVGAGFIIVGDLWAGTGNGFTVGNGATVGLGEVFFTVAADVAPGPYTVSFVTDPSQTNLSDSGGVNIPISFFNSGTITVPESAAPEPTTLALFGVPALLLLLARKYHAPHRG